MNISAMSCYFRKKVKKAVVVFRSRQLQPDCEKLSHWLKERGVQSLFFCQSDIDGKSLEDSADILIVLGGDGTYLSAVHFTQKKNLHALGVNMGSLGFLTVHVKEKLFECLEMALDGKMIVEQRCLLEVREESRQLQHLALNDVVIERGETSQLIDISVYLDGRWIYSLKADGLIIASATGSTAYNLAAGGPILYPTVKAFVVTPICPHSLTHRPVLFPDNCVLKFQVKKPVQGARLTIDGRKRSLLSQSSCVVIHQSQQFHYTLRDPHQCNFVYLKDKLKFFDRSV